MVKKYFISCLVILIFTFANFVYANASDDSSLEGEGYNGGFISSSDIPEESEAGDDTSSKDYMEDSGEVESGMGGGEYMTDSGEVREEMDGGEYMTDSGEIRG